MLVESILRNKEKIRFHTPGHGTLDPSILDCDVTELPYSDNLANPVAELKESEKYLASAFDTEAAFLSTQGATFSIMQAIYACADRGAFLVVGKAHCSIYNGLRLCSAKAYHVDELTDDIPNDVKTVIVTSPDYFGNVLPLKDISSSLHQKGIALIVDSAHGSHFAFSDKLPVSAAEYGDLVILSLHKTMSVITGGSLLLCKDQYASRARYARNLLHSTSPNYMTMCSILNAVEDFKNNGQRYYTDIFYAVENFKNALLSPYKVEKNDDFSRLVVSSPYVGEEVYKAIFDRNFVPEMSFENKVVFIVTHDNYYHLGLLARMFNELPAFRTYVPDAPVHKHERPTELFFGKDWETVDLADSVGRRVFDRVGVYPPGVPLLYDGDTIQKEDVEYLASRADKTFGLENGRVRVLK